MAIRWFNCKRMCIFAAQSHPHWMEAIYWRLATVSGGLSQFAKWGRVHAGAVNSHHAIYVRDLLQLPYSYRIAQNGYNAQYIQFNVHIWNIIAQESFNIRYGQLSLQFVISRSWVRIPQVAQKTDRPFRSVSFILTPIDWTYWLHKIWIADFNPHFISFTSWHNSYKYYNTNTIALVK